MYVIVNKKEKWSILILLLLGCCCCDARNVFLFAFVLPDSKKEKFIALRESLINSKVVSVNLMPILIVTILTNKAAKF